jgi:hypothetical protein
MGRLTTNRGDILYDDDDSDAVLAHQWHVYNFGRIGGVECLYATTTIGGKNVYMHRLLTVPALGVEIDHVNMNGLDNRKENLRLATRSQNSANKPSRLGSSRFKGVCKARTKSDRWRAWIGVNGKSIYLGSFHTEEEAASVYDAAARAAWGAYARINLQE